jgi:hypothetical protein
MLLLSTVRPGLLHLLFLATKFTKNGDVSEKRNNRESEKGAKGRKTTQNGVFPSSPSASFAVKFLQIPVISQNLKVNAIALDEAMRAIAFFPVPVYISSKTLPGRVISGVIWTRTRDILPVLRGIPIITGNLLIKDILSMQVFLLNYYMDY